VTRDDDEQDPHDESPERGHGKRVPGVRIDSERIRNLLPDGVRGDPVDAEEGERREREGHCNGRGHEDEHEICQRSEVKRSRIHARAP
jgi:hypothetical protein